MVIDTGASVNILDEATFSKIQDRKPRTTTSYKQLFSTGSTTPLTILGMFDATNNTSSTSTLHVIQGNYDSLLIYKTAMSLGVIEFHVNHIDTAASQQQQLIEHHLSSFMALETSRE